MSPGRGSYTKAMFPARLEATEAGLLWRTLDEAATNCRRIPRLALAEQLADWLKVLRLQGAGPWQTALMQFTKLSHAGLQAAWQCTFRPYTRESLRNLLHEEDCLDVSGCGTTWPRRLVHIAPSNVLASTLQMLVRGWLLGAAQCLRPSGSEPIFARCLLDSLDSHIPALRQSCAVLHWRHDETDVETAVLSRADVVTLQGDDKSIESMRKKLSSQSWPGRFLGFGWRWSAAVIGRSAQNAEVAEWLARDVTLFDQRGCLSPTHVFLQAGSGNEAWCEKLAGSLAAYERREPRGPRTAAQQASIRYWRERMRLRQVLGQSSALWESPRGTSWGVVLDTGRQILDTPLDRHVVVVPFETPKNLSCVYGERFDRLQGLALAGWDPKREDQIVGIMKPTWLCAPGQLQEPSPSWPQDGKRPLRCFLA